MIFPEPDPIGKNENEIICYQTVDVFLEYEFSCKKDLLFVFQTSSFNCKLFVATGLMVREVYIGKETASF